MSHVGTMTRRIEAERVRLENLAVDACSRVGHVALRHATGALRIGSDPVEAARDVLWGNPGLGLAGMEGVVTRALVTAHLLGLRRTALSARQHFGVDVMHLSRTGDQLNQWLQKLTAAAVLAETEVAGLYQRARGAAGRIVRKITAPLFSRVATAARSITQPAAAPPMPPRRPGETGAGFEDVPEPEPTGLPKYDPMARSMRLTLRELVLQFTKAGFVPGHEHGIGAELSAEMVRSYESGRARGWRTPQISERLWGLHYSAVLDSRTTELCRGLDGTTLPTGDVFWKQWTPPNHYNCFVPGTKVEGAFVGGLKARYTGEVTEINTARGHRLTVTANHPILTSRGWITAAKLKEGDYVLSSRRNVKPVALGVVDDEQGSSRVENVFEAIGAHARRFAPVSPLDLYGDGRYVNGDVEIVSLQRSLLANAIASVTKSVRDQVLVGRYLCQSVAKGLGLFDLLLQRHLSSLGGIPRGTALANNATAIALDSFPLNSFGRTLTAKRDRSRR
jgi:hypothetical protein